MNCNSTGEWIGIGLAEIGINIGIIAFIMISVWGLLSRPETKLWVALGITGTIVGIVALFFV